MGWGALCAEITAWDARQRKFARGGNSSAPPYGPLDAAAIAGRVLRQENYLVALFHLGALEARLVNGRFQMLPRLLEWNVSHAILTSLFEPGSRQVRRDVRRAERRAAETARLARDLRRRAVINAVLAPFTLVIVAVYFAARYGEELRARPGSATAPRFSPLARWRFREFGELPHVLDRRLGLAEASATAYLGMFASHPLVTVVARLGAFVSGTVAVSLLALGAWDEQLLLHEGFFTGGAEGGKSLLFFLGVSSAMFAFCHGRLPSSARQAPMLHGKRATPEQLMRETARHTHHLKRTWVGRCHTFDVRDDFAMLFQGQLVLLGQELLSVLVTPYVLYFQLAPAAGRLVDFVRENTIDVEGLGAVCSLAHFEYSGGRAARLLRSGNDKLEQSLLHFADTYPGWEPADTDGAAFVREFADVGMGAAQASPKADFGTESLIDAYYRDRVADVSRTEALSGSQPSVDGHDRMADSGAVPGYSATFIM